MASAHFQICWMGHLELDFHNLLATVGNVTSASCLGPKELHMHCQYSRDRVPRMSSMLLHELGTHSRIHFKWNLVYERSHVVKFCYSATLCLKQDLDWQSSPMGSYENYHSVSGEILGLSVAITTLLAANLVVLGILTPCHISVHGLHQMPTYKWAQSNTAYTCAFSVVAHTLWKWPAFLWAMWKRMIQEGFYMQAVEQHCTKGFTLLGYITGDYDLYSWVLFAVVWILCVIFSFKTSALLQFCSSDFWLVLPPKSYFIVRWMPHLLDCLYSLCALHLESEWDEGRTRNNINKQTIEA